MKKSVAAVFFGVLLGLPILTQAQKVFRVGILVSEDQLLVAVEGFKKKMGELGYKEGKSITYDVRHANGHPEALGNLAQQLVQNKPDVIVTSSTSATVPVAKLTRETELPVVFLGAADPLRFVESYRSSGNNLTGISTATFDLAAKRLELLKELAPWAKRVASLNNPKGVNYEEYLVSVREAGKRLGLVILELHATNREELAGAMATLKRQTVDGILLQPDLFFSTELETIAHHAAQQKLPLITPPAMNLKRGGLATYGADYLALGQQGAVLVDKLLKGAKPKDLPIEQPSRFVLRINVKTAKTIGLKVPKEVVFRADALVE